MTLLLMDLLEQKKIYAYVGKVGMDRNCPDYYIEKNGKEETTRFIEECLKRNYKYVKPIITPRFTIACTDEYMQFMGEIAKNYSIPVQSHLSENLDEIEFVKELRPDDKFYAESYDKNGLFGREVKTIMAHCVHSPKEEEELIKNNGVYIAHCPTSNSNLASGICPAAKYLRQGYNIGLGSDISGGHTLDLFEVIRHTIQVSKQSFRYINSTEKALTIPEAFYMATNKGGSFFGKVGVFENDYEFDALVLDESLIPNQRIYNEKERLERFIYNKNGKIESKFIKGNRIF
jgi:guanine deaminase